MSVSQNGDAINDAAALLNACPPDTSPNNGSYAMGNSGMTPVVMSQEIVMYRMRLHSGKALIACCINCKESVIPSMHNGAMLCA